MPFISLDEMFSIPRKHANVLQNHPCCHVNLGLHNIPYEAPTITELLNTLSHAFLLHSPPCYPQITNYIHIQGIVPAWGELFPLQYQPLLYLVFLHPPPTLHKTFVSSINITPSHIHSHFVFHKPQLDRFLAAADG